jgi:hypothetical protein
LLWAVVFAVWVILGLIDAGQMAWHFLLTGPSLPLWKVVVLGFTDWCLWAALTPLVLWLAGRYPFRASCWPRRLVLHGTASAGLALLVITLDVPILRALYQPPGPLGSALALWQRFFIAKFHLYTLLYWALLSVSHALSYYRDYRDRSLEAARLEAQLTRAQLDALQMQLNPHFLFNADFRGPSNLPE